jgi:hypothetical protein
MVPAVRNPVKGQAKGKRLQRFWQRVTEGMQGTSCGGSFAPMRGRATGCIRRKWMRAQAKTSR